MSFERTVFDRVYFFLQIISVSGLFRGLLCFADVLESAAYALLPFGIHFVEVCEGACESTVAARI